MEVTRMDNRENRININWYPGHMTKAKRQMQEDIRLIDLIIELVQECLFLAEIRILTSWE